MTSNLLTCQELVELITDYIEEALPPADQERVEAHLASCQGCQGYLSQMKTTIRTLGRLTKDDLAPEVKDDLLNLFRDWKNS